MNPGSILTALLIFGAMVLGLGVIRGEHSINSYFELNDSKKVLSSTVDKLQTETNKLESEILKLKTSKDYAKKVLKDKYHITDDDENIVFFADE